jgi:hypothetical protein
LCVDSRTTRAHAGRELSRWSRGRRNRSRRRSDILGLGFGITVVFPCLNSVVFVVAGSGGISLAQALDRSDACSFPRRLQVCCDFFDGHAAVAEGSPASSRSGASRGLEAFHVVRVFRDCGSGRSRWSLTSDLGPLTSLVDVAWRKNNFQRERNCCICAGCRLGASCCSPSLTSYTEPFTFDAGCLELSQQ